MILPKPIVGKITRGEVTMCCRIPGSLKPRAGARLFVKARTTDEIACHILVDQVTDAILGDVDYDQARRMGYRTTEDLRVAWVRLHDKAWVERQEDGRVDALEDDELVDRFDERHSEREVWVIRFELDQLARPRLLADRNVRAAYVDSPARALDHEPEAVDAATQDRFSQEGYQGWVAREKQREIDRERLAADERLRRVQLEAKAHGVDIGHIEAGILQRLRAAERKIHQRKSAA